MVGDETEETRRSQIRLKVLFLILKGMGLTYSDSPSKKISDCCAEKSLDKARVDTEQAVAIVLTILESWW